MQNDALASCLRFAGLLACLWGCGGHDPEEPTPRTTHEDILLTTCPTATKPVCASGETATCDMSTLTWKCSAGLTHYPGSCSSCVQQ